MNDVTNLRQRPLIPQPRAIKSKNNHPARFRCRKRLRSAYSIWPFQYSKKNQAEHSPHLE